VVQTFLVSIADQHDKNFVIPAGIAGIQASWMTQNNNFPVRLPCSLDPAIPAGMTLLF
jgi:hypothetical protein